MIQKLCWALLAACAWVPAPGVAQAGFTVEQALQTPYALQITGSRDTSRFAWVGVDQGRHSLWTGASGEAARALVSYPVDDGLELRELTWLPGARQLAYTRGPEIGADGKPANAAHLQVPVRVEVWLADLSGSKTKPTLVGEGHSPLPTPDGKHLLLIHNGQIWIADLDKTASVVHRTSPPPATAAEAVPATRGLPQRQLVFDRGSASQMALSPDGMLLAFVSHRDHNHSFLALFDVRAGALSFPAASTGNDSAPAWSPDGRQLAWLRAPWSDAPEFAANRTSANPWALEVLDVAARRTSAAFVPQPKKPGSVLPHVSTGDPRLWWTGDARILFASEADGWVHLYALDPSRPQAPPALLTPGDFEVEDPALSADGRQLVYAANAVASPGSDADRDRRHIWSLDLARPGAHPVLLTPGEGLETHPAFAGGTEGKLQLAALKAGVRSPNQPVLLDPARPGAAPVQLAAADKANATGAVAAQFVTPQPVLFPSADKLFTLHGQLFTPPGPGSAKRPALLFFHGGPRRQMLLGYPAMEYYMRAYALNQYFTAHGFIVLSVNYRRGIGYGLDFREAADTGADGAAEYNDVLGAVAYLRSRPDVDPARIGLWGGSYGGYLTALGLARNSELFAGGVDFHGVHDWILEDNRSDWLRGTAAEQEAIAARAHKSSPLADVDGWRSPVLLIHGDNDANVSYAQTPVLADALKARGVRVEELIFPDEIHEFLLHRDWVTAYKATAEFLERTLKPVP